MRDVAPAAVDAIVLSELGSRFAELGYLTLESIKPGAEARTVTKVTARVELVLKLIDETKAEEEIAQIARIARHVPNFFPRLLPVRLPAGLYATEFVPGTPLDSALDFSVAFDGGREPVPWQLSLALAQLRSLHVASRRAYSSAYHEVIVYHRARSVPDCPRISARFAALQAPGLQNPFPWPASELSRDLARALAAARIRYDQIQPRFESLLHGDPHMGNIIAKPDRTLYFIDPRVSWDGIANSIAGYFDPLYDCACVAHSFIANAILQARSARGPDTGDPPGRLLQSMSRSADAVLRDYLAGPPNEGEETRYLVYAACALLGNLRYPKWTPDLQAFQATVLVAQALLNQSTTS